MFDIPVHGHKKWSFHLRSGSPSKSIDACCRGGFSIERIKGVGKREGVKAETKNFSLHDVENFQDTSASMDMMKN